MKHDFAIHLTRFLVVLSLFLCLSGLSVADTEMLKNRGISVLATQPGDRCLVSGILLNADGIAFIFRGRRVTLHEDAVGVFLAEPDRYFTDQQPKGGLFAESIESQLHLSWLLIGIWMILGLACGAMSSHIALRKGRSAGYWFAAGIVLNVVALATVLVRPNETSNPLPPRLGKVPTTVDPILCPSCGSSNHPTAAVCKSCGTPLNPVGESEVSRI